MTYQEFLELKNRIMDKKYPSISVLMNVEYKVKVIVNDYGKGKLSKSKALSLLETELDKQRDAQTYIDTLYDEIDRLAEQVEL